MARRIVRLHTCIPPGIESSEPIVLPQCGCRTDLTREDAEKMVRDGKAIWRSGGKRQLIHQGKPRVPQARTISSRDIERAYVTGGEGGKNERERIKWFRRGALLEPASLI